MSERYPATVSVALLLNHSRSHRLLLTRHGVKEGGNETWGLVAGGLDKADSPIVGVVKEMYQEGGIMMSDIVMTPTQIANPHVAVISGNDKNRVGLVFEATYIATRPYWIERKIENDEKVDLVRWFSWQMILELLDHPDKIYRPEFNQSQLMRWMVKFRDQNKSSASKVINSWMENKLGTIPGLYFGMGATGHDGRCEYIPPYNNWMEMPEIRGIHSKTSLAC